MRECPEGFRWRNDAHSPNGGYCLDVAKRRASRRAVDARYHATEKGRAVARAAAARYDASEKGRARDARFYAAHPNYDFVHHLHQTWARRAQRIEEHYAQASADA